MKQYIQSCVTCGTITFPKHHRHDFAFAVAKENEMCIVETKATINVTNEIIVEECVKRSTPTKISENKKRFKNSVLEMIKTNENVRNEFLSLLNNICDAGLVLKDSLIFFKDLFKKYEKFVPSLKRKHGIESLNLSFYGFEAFLSMIYIRREFRVSQWLNENTNKFVEKADRERIDKFINQSNVLLLNLERKLQLCGNECGENNGCKYLCLLPKYHEHEAIARHDCYGSHRCEEKCDYCSRDLKNWNEQVSDATQITPGQPLADVELQECGYSAGHGGLHDCNRKDKYHSCGKECSLSIYGNCKTNCCLQLAHDGICKCDSEYHYCNYPCSASKCKQTCIISYEKEHKRHDCGGRSCLFTCEVECGDPTKEGETVICSRPCNCGNHFHDIDIKEGNLGENDCKFHCCMNEHFCGVKCEKKGNCSVKTQRVMEIRDFVSHSGETFKYEWNITANANRKCCNVKIPAGKKKHKGKHLCNSEIHTCDIRCPSCKYFCDKQYNHRGLHG